jgi:plasmid stabilization system protein ParE
VAYEVAWTESALASLVSAIEYIARDSPSYAAAFAVRAERVAASLVTFPERGRRVSEFNDPNVRELPVASHRLIYRVAHNRVLLLAFLHQSRNLASLLNETAQ